MIRWLAESEGPFFTRYLNLLFDPAHWSFELTLQLLIDGLIIGLGWRYVKAHIHRDIKRRDEAHGHEHTDLHTED